MPRDAQHNAVVFWGPRLIGLACLTWLVYEWLTGSSGLSMSEGHRAIPAWEMMQNGNWLSPTMFEQPYLRKPPGMAWAIAGMSSFLGQTELAARSVSALSMLMTAMASAWFASRWFGRGAAFAAGAMHLLTPWFWESGRAAEIEALHNLGVALAIWGLVDQCVMSGRGRHLSTLAITFAGICIAGLAKGPAAGLVLVALGIAALIVKPTGLQVRRGQVVATLASAAVVLGGLGWIIWQRSHAGTVAPITQSVAEFLWSWNRVGKIATMPLTVALSAMPLTALAWWAWRSVRASGDVKQPIAGADATRLIVLTAGIALALFALAGVSNPRYLLPVGAILSPVAGLALHGLLTGPKVCRSALIGRTMAQITVLVLLVGSVFYSVFSERGRGISSGKSAGIRLADQLAEGSVIVADDLIEARPEVLWYARQAAQQRGKAVRFVWTPASLYAPENGPAQAWPEATHALIRIDGRSNEAARLDKDLKMLGLRPTDHTDRVGPASRPFEYRLFAKPVQNP